MTKEYVQENFLVLSLNVFHEVREPGQGVFGLICISVILFFVTKPGLKGLLENVSPCLE